MRGRYHDIMDKIAVTEEMSERILSSIHSLDVSRPSKKIRLTSWKKYLSIAACFLIFLSSALFLSRIWERNLEIPSQPGPEIVSRPPVEAIPDIAAYDSAKELSDAAGFSIQEFTHLPFETKSVTYVLFWKQLAEIKYIGESQSLTFRKTEGSGDNSGDFNPYDASQTIKAGSCEILLKGNGDSFHLALWEDGGYSYSLRSSLGMPVEDWNAVLLETGC